MTCSPAIKSAILVVTLLFTTTVFAQKDKKSEKDKKSDKNKYIEGKKYDVTFTEVKTTGTAKPLPSLIQIKGGKVQSDLMEQKLTAPEIPYKVTLDTTYIEDESEVRKVAFIAEYTEEKTTYKWDVTVIDYSIEGSCIMLKSGVQKKKFEFTGEEKAKKK
jgi:hypothetical protein